MPWAGCSSSRVRGRSTATSRSVRSLATTNGGAPSSRASSRRRRRNASNRTAASGGRLPDPLGAGGPSGARAPNRPAGGLKRPRPYSRGRTRHAGRSPFMTARPAPVSRTTGRSPGVKSTQPAVTQRRRTRVSHSSEWPLRLPKVGTDLQVVGPEVVAPFADAVGLVHRHQGDAEVSEQAAETRIGEALRGDVGQLEGAGPDAAETLAHLRGGERRGQEGGGNPPPFEGLHLVVHERDERGDDEGGAGKQAGRELVDQALPAAGGSHEQEPALREQGKDGLSLAGTELRIAEASEAGVQVERGVAHRPAQAG